MTTPIKCPFCEEPYSNIDILHYCNERHSNILDNCTNIFCDYNLKNGATCRGKNCLDYYSTNTEEEMLELIKCGKEAEKQLKSFAIYINNLIT